MRISFCENRLIHMAPPEGPKPPGEKPQVRPPEDTETNRQKRRDLASEPASELTEKVPSEAEKRNKELKEKAKIYHEELLKAETPEKIEELRKKAESDDVSLIDLRGGWEWLGLKESEQEKKFAAISKIYLEKTTNENGQESFRVKAELNNIPKIKYGIGAGHLLPPSIQAVEIRDLKGNTRQGTRRIEGNRVGYFDSEGYIPIFSGYRITPLAFIDEQSAPYKQALDAEKQLYTNTRDAATQYQDATKNPEGLSGYQKKQNYPISTLKSLNKATKQELEKELPPEEVEQIQRAQIDMFRIDAVRNKFNLHLDDRTEINGGLHLVTLNGKGATIMGYTSQSLALEQDWITKLQNTEYIKTNLKDGNLTLSYPGNISATLKVELKENQYIFSNEKGEKIENIGQWVIYQAGKLAEKTPTTTLIQSMQNGGDYEGFRFRGNYELNLTHLVPLYNATSDKNFLHKTLTELAKIKSPIEPESFIAKLYQHGTMSLQEAKEHAKKIGMDMLTSGTIMLDNLRNKNKRPGYKSYDYNWNADGQHLNYGGGVGTKCCAYMVSKILGLEGKQREGMVSELVSRIIRGNEEKYGNAGIVFGFENYIKGDVIVWNRDDNGSYRHVGIIRETLYIDGEKYIAIQHDESHIQVDIVPVRQGVPVKKLSEALISRQKPEDQAKLNDILGFRSQYKHTVRIRPNASWWGDASKTRGRKSNILFAVRTDWSNSGGQQVADAASKLAVPEIPAAFTNLSPVSVEKPAEAATAPAAAETPTAKVASPSTLPETLTTSLQKNIEKIVENMKGTVAVSIYDPETGKYLAHLNENQITPPASLIKVPILFALHKAVEAGRVDEKDFQNLKDHAEKMIVDSNNHSTDVIIKHLGMKWINQCFQELKLKDTKLNRFLFYKDSQELERNWSTAQDMTKIMALAITQKPPAGWPSAMDLMELNASKAGPGSLAKTLPQNVKIAQKGGQLNKSLGALHNVEHYAATFTLGKKNLVMIVMVSDFDTRNNAKEGIRKIGKLAYNELERKNNDNAETAQKAPEKSDNELIETSYNGKSFPTYIDYPKNPGNKPVEYLTYLHGDGSNLDNSKAKVLSYVNSLRAQGRNIVLIMPEADRKGTRAASWDWLNQQPSPFDKIIAHAKTKAGEGKLNVVSFSGGYRALNHIKANSNQQINEITMLDSSYPRSKDTLKYYADKNTKVTLITGEGDQSVQTNQTASSLQGTKNIKIVQSKKYHGDVNLGFLKGELPA